MTNSSKQKSEVVLYNQLMKDFRIAERQKIMGRFKKTLWFIAILLLLLLALKFYYPRQPNYVTRPNTKGMPETEIVGVYPKNFESITGGHVQQVLQKKPEKIKKMRIKNMGKFHGLKIKESESMYWPLLENAHIESLDLYGTHIEPDAWNWLQTIKNFDNNLELNLTNQKLDDAFYAGLSGLLEGKNMDGITIATSPKQIDFCRLIFPVSFNGIRLSLEKYPLPDDTYIIINNPGGGLSYLDKKSGRNITKEVRFGTLPWLLWDERKEDYDLTEHGQDQWRKLHCTKKEK